MFASSIDTLADFGLAARKRRAPKPSVKVEAAALAMATRQARATKGKKQKAKIKGAVAQPAPRDFARCDSPGGGSAVIGTRSVGTIAQRLT